MRGGPSEGAALRGGRGHHLVPGEGHGGEQEQGDGGGEADEGAARHEAATLRHEEELLQTRGEGLRGVLEGGREDVGLDEVVDVQQAEQKGKLSMNLYYISNVMISEGEGLRPACKRWLQLLRFPLVHQPGKGSSEN